MPNYGEISRCSKGINSFFIVKSMNSVFFKPGKFGAFDEMMQADPSHLRELIRKVEKWLVCAKWRWAQYGVLMAIKEYFSVSAKVIQKKSQYQVF